MIVNNKGFKKEVLHVKHYGQYGRSWTDRVLHPGTTLRLYGQYGRSWTDRVLHPGTTLRLYGQHGRSWTDRVLHPGTTLRLYGQYGRSCTMLLHLQTLPRNKLLPTTSMILCSIQNNKSSSPFLSLSMFLAYS